MKQTLTRSVVGWLAVAVATGIACLWAFWGIIENFHEGWYLPSLAQNLELMVVQYLSFLAIFLALALLALRWPIPGAVLFAGLGVWIGLFFLHGGPAGITLVLVPMLLLAALFAFGRPRPVRRAMLVLLLLPGITLVLAGAYPAYRVATREKTVFLGAFDIRGNGVNLEWAPAGPGWPDNGMTWDRARWVCRHLSRDGSTVLHDESGIWRLPTADEVARSMNLHGRNAQGSWDPVTGSASYRLPPDKEGPLWNPRSKVIYWWTATEDGADNALIMVYDGKLWPRAKRTNAAYLAFRAVRDLSPGPR